MAPLLELRSAGRRLTTSRSEESWIWRRQDLSLEPGDRLALVGSSGSGKTLLLRALAALDVLQEGEIRFQGRSLEAWDIPQYRAAVLYLPQAVELMEGTVEENLQFPFTFRVHRRAGRTYRPAAARALLEKLHREELLGRHTDDLSGGERQVAALVRALLLDPTVLLLDEAMAGMDEALTRAAEGLVEEWLEGGGRAVVWTSHHAEQLERVTDRRRELA